MSSSPAIALLPRKAPETPPSSDIERDTSHLPPSPPLSPKRRTLSTVDRLIGVLKLRKVGRLASESDWRIFRLFPTDFAELQERLRREEGLLSWYEDKVRYDYDPARGEYVLRMPSALHECFIASVEDAITGAIAALVERLGGSESEDDVKVAQCLGEVYKGRSTTIELHAPRLENSSQETQASGGEDVVIVRPSPDATLYHPFAPACPALVLEVSYSQQRKDLPRLAESYIVDSRHAVRCVISLDIPYTNMVGKKGKKAATAKDRNEVATVSIWRPGTETDEDGDEVGICRQDTDAIPFRNTDGTACAGALNLTIADILPISALSTLHASAANDQISIPFANLASFLAAAERSTTTNPLTTPTVPTTAAPTKFRKRKRTPSEELSSGREEEYTRQEEQEVERDRSADGAWRARSRQRRRRVECEGDGRDVQVVVSERRRSLRKAGRGSGRGVGGAS
ncbi:hypothetical protein LTR85_011112 [Meristemomyces frigidus]|nr:hypothetical protein LTR85_011112 [Meristemomyces frigidus]